MKTLEINGELWFYLGEPFAVRCDDQCGLTAVGNIRRAKEGKPRKVWIHSLADAFACAEEWAANNDHLSGYVLDFANRTVYYDNDRALRQLKRKIFPQRNLVGYFTTFTQRSFKK